MWASRSGHVRPTQFHRTSGRRWHERTMGRTLHIGDCVRDRVKSVDNVSAAQTSSPVNVSTVSIVSRLEKADDRPAKQQSVSEDENETKPMSATAS